MQTFYKAHRCFLHIVIFKVWYLQEYAFDYTPQIYHLTFYFCKESETIEKFVYWCLSHNVFWYFFARIKFYWIHGFRKITKLLYLNKILNQAIYQIFLSILNQSTKSLHYANVIFTSKFYLFCLREDLDFFLSVPQKISKIKSM